MLESNRTAMSGCSPRHTISGRPTTLARPTHWLDAEHYQPTSIIPTMLLNMKFLLLTFASHGAQEGRTKGAVAHADG